MIWQTRARKNPPPEFLADIIEHYHQAHGVGPSSQLVTDQFPVWRRKWREGATALEVFRALEPRRRA